MYVIKNPLNTKNKETPIPPPFLINVNIGKDVMGRCKRNTLKNAKNRIASNV
jgi:hypothetical protein